MSDFGPFSPVTPDLVAELANIVGQSQVIYGDSDRLVDFSHDETIGAEYAHMPDVVVKPRSAEQISEVLRLANRVRVPVTPRGAGSGMSGGAVAVYGGIVLSVELMNHILEIDRENMVAVVEPGVITNDLSLAVREFGLFFPGYPMSVEMCFIGGNVAENAGGGRAVKYGVTGRYVMSLEVVLPTGEIIHLGGKRVKDVTGYDLIHLMVGSEGTLGIFSKITLRLLPEPVARAVLLAPFRDIQSAIDAVPKIMTRGRVIPSSIEFMDRLSLETAYAHEGNPPPDPEIGAMLLFEVDGSSQDQVEAEYAAIVNLCHEAGAIDAFIADSPAKEKKMWRSRQVMPEAFKALTEYQTGEDIVVPLAGIPVLMKQLEELSGKYDVLMPCFAHVGDGNMHIHIISRPTTSPDEWHALLPRILTDLYTRVAALGGTLSGEHGIGHKRSRYLPLVMEPKVIELHRRIKAAFDPNGILNPGKILPVGPYAK